MRTKSILFINERNEILSSIFNILKIDEVNNTFYLHDLDNDIDIQNKILELEDNIKNYFKYGSWGCFVNEKNQVKRKVLSIIRNVLKDMNYDLIPKRVVRKNGNNIQRDSIYYIIKK
jgi:alpha-amylase/alpha-mannosidase (GH57 family)